MIILAATILLSWLSSNWFIVLIGILWVIVEQIENSQKEKKDIVLKIEGIKEL